MTHPQLSEKVLDLIQKSRIVSFASWQDQYSAETIQYFQAADDQKRYLSDTDLEQLQQLAPSTSDFIPVVQQLRDQVNEIIQEARAKVLQTFPTITQPGGGLYPEERANACWRDFWHFLRCITYGIAGQRLDYTSAEGFQSMGLLYQELQVPLDAMILGLEGIKTASLHRVEAQQADVLAPYFDHLIQKLQPFQQIQ